jgi:hypothetical protein
MAWSTWMPNRDDTWQDVLADTSGLPVFLTDDKDGVAVFLSHEVWSDHILARHPEVESFKELIVLAIRNPDVRQPDPEDDRVWLYYKNVPERVRPFRKALFLRVIVKYVYPPERQEQRTGLISAIYFVDKVKKGGKAI